MKNTNPLAGSMNGYFMLDELPSQRDWIGELIDNISPERISSRFPAGIARRSGEVGLPDAEDVKAYYRKRQSNLLVAIRNGEPVGLCECASILKKISIAILTAGGNHLPGFAAEARRRWPSFLVGGSTPAIADVATHRLYCRHLDFIETSHTTADGLVLHLWERGGLTLNLIEPSMSSTELATAYLLASQLLFEQTGESPEAALANAILGLQASLQHTRHATTIEAVTASFAAMESRLPAIRNALMQDVPEGVAALIRRVAAQHHQPRGARP
jgi:hypothetical protein